MIDPSLDTAQCFLDPPSQSFLHVVTLVESLLEQQTRLPARLDSSPQSRLSHYSFDLGVIGPLFYIAVRCWHPLLHRKAISMLQHPEIPHREGIWHASMTVTMAERIIDVEEEVIQLASTVGGKNDEEVQAETLKKKVWFDFVRPKKDQKQLKIVVGTKREKPRECREEVITWWCDLVKSTAACQKT